jgi:hypothetical protein
MASGNTGYYIFDLRRDQQVANSFAPDIDLTERSLKSKKVCYWMQT